MKRLLSKYGKAVAAVVFAALTVGSSALSDGTVDAGERVQIAIAATTAIGVWFVPNVPGASGVKTGVAIILAVLNAATAYIAGGVDAGEVVNLILAGLGVVAIGAAPAWSVGDHLVSRPVAAAMRVPPEAVPPRL